MAEWQIFIIFAAIMEKIKDINDSGVLISQDAIENSLHKKAQRKLTLAQLPVYRAVGNLKYVIIGIAKNAPRNLRRFTDSLYEEADNLATSIGSADVSFSVEDRRWYTARRKQETHLLRSGENRAGNQFLSRLLRTSSIISDTQGEHHQPR